MFVVEQITNVKEVVLRRCCRARKQEACRHKRMNENHLVALDVAFGEAKDGLNRLWLLSCPPHIQMDDDALYTPSLVSTD